MVSHWISAVAAVYQEAISPAPPLWLQVVISFLGGVVATSFFPMLLIYQDYLSWKKQFRKQLEQEKRGGFWV